MTRFYYDTPSALHITVPARYDCEHKDFLERLKQLSSKAAFQDNGNDGFSFLKRLSHKYWTDFYISITEKRLLLDLLGVNSVEVSGTISVIPENMRARRTICDIIVASTIDLLCLNEIDFGSPEIDVDSEVRILEHYRKLVKGN